MKRFDFCKAASINSFESWLEESPALDIIKIYDYLSFQVLSLKDTIKVYFY